MIKANPRATAFLNTLRGLGYSVQTALADIIDNSISAGATEVDLFFHWEGRDSWIAIKDNGSGMSRDSLITAMTLGGRNPLEKRIASDLGRFGIGMKTASLSQCQTLTVISKTSTSDSSNCLRLDLYEQMKNGIDDWVLFEGPRDESLAFTGKLELKNHGTLVLWERLDRIVATSFTHKSFLDLIDVVYSHLSMVFHKYLENKDNLLTLRINERKVAPWDPFMKGHISKPWESPVVVKEGPWGLISVQSHVLPHKDRLSNSEFDNAAGPLGWNLHQGFYIYRNHRLLVHGGWLGLGAGRSWTREEANRLARISIEISNAEDFEWNIDIKKSVARVPASLKDWLTQIAEDTRSRARRVLAYRSTPNTFRQGFEISLDGAWKSVTGSRGKQYKINRDDILVKRLFELVANERRIFEKILCYIEESVPVERVWLDTVEQDNIPSTNFCGSPTNEVVEAIEIILEDMIVYQRLSKDLAVKLVSEMSPFARYKNLIEDLARKIND